MTASRIAAECMWSRNLTAGEAMYYSPVAGTVVVGKTVWQPTGTCRLRVGPDEVKSLVVADIEAAIQSFTLGTTW